MLLRREVPADAVRVTANLPLHYTAAGLADATVAVDVTIGNALSDSACCLSIEIHAASQKARSVRRNPDARLF